MTCITAIQAGHLTTTCVEAPLLLYHMLLVSWKHIPLTLRPLLIHEYRMTCSQAAAQQHVQGNSA